MQKLWWFSMAVMLVTNGTTWIVRRRVIYPGGQKGGLSEPLKHTLATGLVMDWYMGNSVLMYTYCTDWGTTLQLKQVLIEFVVIMWLSIHLLVATQCKLQTLNDHSTSHSDNTSKVYEAKSKILCRAIKEQPTPVEGNVKGNKQNIILCPWLR